MSCPETRDLPTVQGQPSWEVERSAHSHPGQPALLLPDCSPRGLGSCLLHMPPHAPQCLRLKAQEPL